MKISDNPNAVFEAKGKFIRFGGQGILDGLQQNPCKRDFYQIIGEYPGSKTSVNGLEIKAYRAKKHSILPFYRFNQEYEIINKESFKHLPEYAF